MRHSLAYGLLAASLQVNPTLAAAQDAAAGTLEEVVVTAQKRAENLQDIPIAVTAFTATDIERQGFTNIAQMAEFTPNVIFDTTTSISGLSSGAAVFIRGIGQIDFGLTTDPGVGTYVDGVYMSRSVGGVLDTLDVERVEILRGPQGTLFGRNTIGGALNVTTQQPGRDFEGVAEFTVGEFDRIDVRGAVNLPLGDTLALRLSASSKQRDGYVERVLVGDELGDENRQSYRAALSWTPGRRFKAYATADYSRIDENSAASVLAGITQAPNVVVYNTFDAPGNNVPGFGNGIPYDARFITSDPDRTYADGPTGTNLDVGGAALTLTYSFDALEVKSISAWRRTKGEFYRDPDNSPLVITHTSNPEYDHEQITQEFTFTGEAGDRLEYVAGLFYLTEEGTDNVYVPLAPSLGEITNLADIDNDSIAGYGQATWKITDLWRLTGGLRYTEDDKSFTPYQRILFGPAGPAPGVSVPLVPDETVDATFEQTTGRVAVEFVPGDSTLYYASFTQGFKSGGFNFRYVVPRAEALAFDPETVDSYEAGFKWQGAGDRVRVNASVFFMDYQDIQVQVFEVGGGPLTQNAGTAEIRGAELEIAALPTPQLQLSLGLGYTDAEYTDLNPPTTDLAASLTLDTKLPNTPEWTANASAEYTVPIPWGSIAFRVDYSHTDDVWNDAQNSPFLFQKAYDLWNAAVRYTSPKEAWEVALFATNLGDERYITSGDSNYGLGFHEANYNRPRELGLTVRRRF
jgi:iron complex outermembrane receptor protein